MTTAALSANPLRAALYGRVSLDPHGRSRSPGQQQSAGEQVCADEGWINAGTYTDGGVGASRLSKKAREDWARLLADITAGRIDVVIVWEWSRADRNLTTGSAFLDLCRAHGVLIHVVSDERTYDVTRRPKDWEILAKGLVDNAMESERNSSRSRRDRAGRVAAGIVDGRITYGYERTYHPHTREFIEQRAHAEHAPIVREIVTKAGQGVPITAITAGLNDRGVPAPKGGAWCRASVRGIALNPAYVSKRLVDGKLWPVDWPAIVSEDEHRAAVRVLTDPARTTTRPGRAHWLVSYIAVCGDCGGPLQVMTRGRPGHRFRLYICSAKQCVAISVGPLEDAVVTKLLLHLSDPAVHEQLTRPDTTAAATIKDELAALEGRLAEFRAGAGTVVSLETVAAAERNLLPLIAEAQGRLAALNPASGALRALLGHDPAQAGYADLLARWADLTVAQRREIVRETVTVTVGRLKRKRVAGVGLVGEVGERIRIEPR